jgi:hypothetical protein
MVAQAQPHKLSRFGPHKQAGRAQCKLQCYLLLSRRSDYQSGVRARFFDKQHHALGNGVLASQRIPLAGSARIAVTLVSKEAIIRPSYEIEVAEQARKPRKSSTILQLVSPTRSDGAYRRPRDPRILPTATLSRRHTSVKEWVRFQQAGICASTDSI